MRKLRYAAAFLAGALAPAIFTMAARAACDATDVCLVEAIVVVYGVPLGVIAGVVAALLAPSEGGGTGYLLAAAGVPVGFVATFAALGSPESAAPALLPFGVPMIIALGLGYGLTRFLRRPFVSNRRPRDPTEPA